MTVVELAHLHETRAHEVAERLAQWHTAEWGHLYHPEVWNLSIARHEFAEQRRHGGGRTPTTYVAIADAEQLVGSVSLVDTDDLPGFETQGPWLASLFVEPSRRHQGVGHLLVNHLLTQEPARTAEQVYLFTADHADWYAGWGWRPVAVTTSGPAHEPVTVMVRSSGADADSAPLRHRGA